jgi:short-subunit dehydrogenase
VAAKAMPLGAQRVEVVAIDLGEHSAPRAIFERLSSAEIHIDYLVNNAGFGTTGRFDRLPLAREIEEIDLNVRALVELTGLFLPAMLKRRSGTIINVASTAAFQPLPYMATYAATKAFVLSFSEGLAGELDGSGVNVLALCPGPVKTEFQAVAKNQNGMIPSFAYMEPDRVVEQAIAAAARGRSLRINGAMNNATAQATRFLPRAVVNRIARRIYRDSGD